MAEGCALGSQTHLRSMEGFPLQDLLPGLLVVLVVDSDNVIHVFLTDVIFLPFPPRKDYSVRCDDYDWIARAVGESPATQDAEALLAGVFPHSPRMSVQTDMHVLLVLFLCRILTSLALPS